MKKIFNSNSILFLIMSLKVQKIYKIYFRIIINLKTLIAIFYFLLELILFLVYLNIVFLFLKCLNQ